MHINNRALLDPVTLAVISDNVQAQSIKKKKKGGEMSSHIAASEPCALWIGRPLRNPYLLNPKQSPTQFLE